MTSLKTSIKTITYLSDIGCLEIQGASLLISLFRQFGGTELRLKLVWLCWLDLMTGNSLEDWKENLKRKSEKELEEWIINRQRQSAALTDLMDQYVLLAYRTTVDDSRN
ncbi:hypothetical protein AWP79_12740 [Escherichia coli]|nr:hypothetical protein AWP79_12740 [Escherichia coli]